MMGDQRYFGKGHSRAPDTERGGVALSAGGSCQPATLQHFDPCLHTIQLKDFIVLYEGVVGGSRTNPKSARPSSG